MEFSVTDASSRIADEFDRLVSLDSKEIAGLAFAERVVNSVVMARCSRDMSGIDSVFDQILSSDEVSVLIDGLLALEESAIAETFARARTEFDANGTVSQETDEQIGERLWELDEKLVALLNGETP